MSYLRYLCLFAHSGVQHIVCFRLTFRVPNVASFFELPIPDCPFSFL